MNESHRPCAPLPEPTPGCGCSSDPCGDCSPGPLARPSFFHGMLLTDTDLQALVDYGTAKQRLHNRYIHGSGVACGLAITCHPCGGSKVIVQPGYALDCCGNDLLVSCPTELDIKPMARELRARLTGSDCGDPCKPPTKDGCGDRDKPGARRYCLYIHYCEQSTNPVAPYATGNDCGNLECEPTRIAEGVRFELRCPTDDPEPPSLCSRIEECVGDLRQAETVSRDTKTARSFALQSSPALQGIRSATPAVFTSADAQLLKTELPVLQADAEKLLAKGELEEAEFRASLDRTAAIGQALVRFHYRDYEDREEIGTTEPERAVPVDDYRETIGSNESRLYELVSQGIELVSRVAPELRRRTPGLFESPIERALADATLETTAKLVSFETPRSAFSGPLAIAYTWGAAYTPAAYRALADTLRTQRGWLLARLEKRPPFGECSLIREINAIAIPGGNKPDPNAVIVAVEALFRAYLRYLLDCICAVLLPPCPPCDDTGVKLACFDFDDCEVDNICNLERTFLLTGPNLSYWVPMLHKIGEALEYLCCNWSPKLDIPLDKPRKSAPPPAEEVPYNPKLFTNNQPTYSAKIAETGLPYLMSLAGISTDRAESQVNLAGNLGGMVLAEPALSPLAGMLDAGALGGMAVESTLSQPQVSAGLDRAVASRIDKMAPQPVSEAAITELDAKVEEGLSRLDREIEKRATLDGLPNTRVIRDLRKVNDEQGKRIEELLSANSTLLARVEKLENGRRK